MKKLTLTQKKWAMTTSLLLALGLNTSFNDMASATFTADFASTSPTPQATTIKIKTKHGNATVQYTKLQDGNTAVVVTEGRVCSDCDSSMFMIPGKATDDVRQMTLALQKYLDKQEERPRTSSETIKEVAEIDLTKTKKSKTATDKLDDLAESCEKSDEESRQLECYSSQFPKLLKREKLSSSAAKSFFEDRIAPLMRGQLQLANSTEDFSEAREIKKETLESIKSLLRDIPSRHETVRKSLMTQQKMFISDAAMDVVKTHKESEQLASSNPALATQLLQLANTKRGELIILTNGGNGFTGLSQINHQALQDASQIQKNTSQALANTYYTDFMQYANQAMMDITTFKATPFDLSTQTASGVINMNLLNGTNTGTQVLVPGQQPQGVTVIQSPYGGNIMFGPEVQIDANMRNRLNLQKKASSRR